MPKKGTYVALGGARPIEGGFSASAQLSEAARIKIAERRADAASQSEARKNMQSILSKAKSKAVVDFSTIHQSTWGIAKKILDRHQEDSLTLRDEFMANPTPDLEYKIQELNNRFDSDISKLVMIGNDMTSYMDKKSKGDLSLMQNLGIDEAMHDFSTVTIPEMSKTFDGSTESLDLIISAYTDNVSTADAIGAVDIPKVFEGLADDTMSDKLFEGKGKGDIIVNDDGSKTVTMHRHYDRKSAKDKFMGIDASSMRELQLMILGRASTTPDMARYLDEDENGEMFVSRDKAFEYYEETYLKPNTKAGTKRIGVSARGKKEEEEKENDTRTFDKTNKTFDGDFNAFFVEKEVVVDGIRGDVERTSRVYDVRTGKMAVRVDYSYKEKGKPVSRSKLYSDDLAGRHAFANEYGGRGFDYDKYVSDNGVELEFKAPTIDEISLGVTEYISQTSQDLDDAIMIKDIPVVNDIKAVELLKETISEKVGSNVVNDYIKATGRINNIIRVGKGKNKKEYDIEEQEEREEMLNEIGTIVSIAEGSDTPAESIDSYLTTGKNGISVVSDYISELDGDSEKNAAKLEANRMLKEGKTEKEVVDSLKDVGDDRSMLDDFVGEHFAGNEDAASAEVKKMASANGMTIKEFIEYYKNKKK